MPYPVVAVLTIIAVFIVILMLIFIYGAITKARRIKVIRDAMSKGGAIVVIRGERNRWPFIQADLRDMLHRYGVEIVNLEEPEGDKLREGDFTFVREKYPEAICILGELNYTSYRFGYKPWYLTFRVVNSIGRYLASCDVNVSGTQDLPGKEMTTRFTESLADCFSRLPQTQNLTPTS